MAKPLVWVQISMRSIVESSVGCGFRGKQVVLNEIVDELVVWEIAKSNQFWVIRFEIYQMLSPGLIICYHWH